MVKTNIPVHNTTHGKMITLALVNSKEEFLNVLEEGKENYMFLWVSKQLLWFTHWHVCM